MGEGGGRKEGEGKERGEHGGPQSFKSLYFLRKTNTLDPKACITLVKPVKIEVEQKEQYTERKITINQIKPKLSAADKGRGCIKVWFYWFCCLGGVCLMF